MEEFFQRLYLNNWHTDPIIHFCKEQRYWLHYIFIFSWVNYFEFGISHQQTTFYFVIAKHERGWGGGSGGRGMGFGVIEGPIDLYTYILT